MQNAECRMQNRNRTRFPILQFSFCILHSALLLITLPISAAQNIDTLITGGTVVTMAGPNIENGSVAIHNGEIVAVGPSAEIDGKFTPTTRIKAAGMAVVPGFVNAHTH